VFDYLAKKKEAVYCEGCIFSDSAHHESPVAVGKHTSLPCSIGITKATCILCQEEQEVTHNSRAMVLAGFVQR
jgi:E3 ubiquitin-protein ligase UBR2